MRKTKSAYLALFAVLLAPMAANADLITLDAETVATGSQLDSAPLVTTSGTITYTGHIKLESAGFRDIDMQNAGSFGANFSALNGIFAAFSFDFDVNSITFVYGGNGGDFEIFMLDGIGNVLNSFFQPSTGNGLAAGPLTLVAADTREIVWRDTTSWAAIDNVTLETTTVPEPGTLGLLGIGLAGMGLARRRRKV